MCSDRHRSLPSVNRSGWDFLGETGSHRGCTCCARPAKPSGKGRGVHAPAGRSLRRPQGPAGSMSRAQKAPQLLRAVGRVRAPSSRTGVLGAWPQSERETPVRPRESLNLRVSSSVFDSSL